MKWYLKCLRNYFKFSGRARPMEYWMFQLYRWIILLILLISFFNIRIDRIISSVTIIPWHYFVLFYIIATIIPNLAVTVRRLHDAGKSGWWFFISLVPLIGSIWLLILLIDLSVPGENKWGPNPKEVQFNNSNDDIIDGDIIK